MNRILLLGYYGHRNFGDDVLFKVTYSLVHSAWPEARIFTRCSGAQFHYLKDLVAGPLEVLPYVGGGQFDLIVHGGGGTFFDFQVGTWRDRLLNGLVLACGGRVYSKLDALARALVRRPRDRAQYRVGFGLGIGTFTRSSPRLRDKAAVLMDFRGLMVRDPASLENLRRLGLDVQAACGSDLAFMHEQWWEGSCPAAHRAAIGKPRIGIVLRDWPHRPGKALMDATVAAVPDLSQRFDITFLVVDEAADVETLRALQGQRVLTWNPAVQSLSDYSRSMSEFDVLVSARAHGGICGAVVGVPSLLLGIEAKLGTVHEMLPRSTRLLQPGASVAELQRGIDDLLGLDRGVIASEVAANRAKSRHHVQLLLDAASAARCA